VPRLLVSVTVLLVLIAAPAAALGHTGPGHPGDSDAPPGAPPHWIPGEDWVAYHWLPYDEARLHALLGTTRTGLWRFLRDDRHTLGQLARRRGFRDLDAFAVRLVGSGATAVLRRRALRTLTQGHLSQHILFHSLHQDAGPERARAIFGVAGTAEFQRLRRLDLSPLRIGRANGRTRARMQSAITRALRAKAREGVARGAVSRRQAALFLARQLRQVPRWLAEDHYNGPPETVRGKPRHPFRPAFASPALTADGTAVFFDAQQPAPPLAVRFGEVNVEGLSLTSEAGLAPRDASPAAREARPCSSFDPAVSGDGRRIAFEVSAGNRTFAKRYGNVVIAVADLVTRRVRALPLPRGRVVRTAYAPAISGDGDTVAFQAVDGDAMSPRAARPTRVLVTDLGTGRTVAVARGDAYEPSLSADGSRVAFTRLRRGRLQVFVLDRRTGRTVLASRLPDGTAPAEAYAPSLSGDGHSVAFAVAGGRVVVRDLATATSRRMGIGSEPSLSADGGVVALSRPAPGRTSAGRPRQQVVVRDVRTAAETVASVGPAGAADGWSGQPSLSGDGRRVAFTTDAPALGAGGPGPGGLAVMVRDLAAGATVRASPRAPLARFGSGAGALEQEGRAVCAMAPPAW
jgi:Tol biopolymer transport system component